MDSSSKLCISESRVRTGGVSSAMSAANSLDFVPDELIARILALLPYSSIAMARGVCRRWRSIIWSPLFLSMCKLRPVRMPWLLEFQQHMYNQAWAYDLEGRQWFHVNFFFLPENATIVASNGGLLCLSAITGAGCALFICNPLTRQWRKLPTLPIQPSHFLVDVDRNSNHYRVIALFVGGGADTYSSSVCVFDPKIGIWRETGGVPAELEQGGLQDATITGGLLYCLTASRKMELYDLDTGNWSRFPIPCSSRLLLPPPFLQPRLLRFNLPGFRLESGLSGESYICGRKGQVLMVTPQQSLGAVIIDKFDAVSRCWKTYNKASGKVICSGRFSSLCLDVSDTGGHVYLSHAEGNKQFSPRLRACQQLPRSPLTRYKMKDKETLRSGLWFEPRIDASV